MQFRPTTDNSHIFRLHGFGFNVKSLNLWTEHSHIHFRCAPLFMFRLFYICYCYNACHARLPILSKRSWWLRTYCWLCWFVECNFRLFYLIFVHIVHGSVPITDTNRQHCSAIYTKLTICRFFKIIFTQSPVISRYYNTKYIHQKPIKEWIKNESCNRQFIQS